MTIGWHQSNGPLSRKVPLSAEDVSDIMGFLRGARGMVGGDVSDFIQGTRGGLERPDWSSGAAHLGSLASSWVGTTTGAGLGWRFQVEIWLSPSPRT